MKTIDLAITILSDVKTEMTVHEIAANAISRELIKGVSQDSLVAKLSSSLSSSVKRKDSPFTRVKNSAGGFKRGVYKLKRGRSQPIETNFPPELEDVSDTGYVGRGGEYAVMSELLFRGFNVSLMSVDKGIDIIAADEKNKYYHVQVKTATSKDGLFRFTIKKKSFEANDSGSTFYVLVLRRDKRCDYIVMPSSQISTFMGTNVIRGGESLSLTVRIEGKRFTINNAADISIYVNSFRQIR
jgi:hypothetical protein